MPDDRAIAAALSRAVTATEQNEPIFRMGGETAYDGFGAFFEVDQHGQVLAFEDREHTEMIRDPDTDGPASPVAALRRLAMRRTDRDILLNLKADPDRQQAAPAGTINRRVLESLSPAEQRELVLVKGVRPVDGAGSEVKSSRARSGEMLRSDFNRLPVSQQFETIKHVRIVD